MNCCVRENRRSRKCEYLENQNTKMVMIYYFYKEQPYRY